MPDKEPDISDLFLNRDTVNGHGDTSQSGQTPKDGGKEDSVSKQKPEKRSVRERRSKGRYVLLAFCIVALGVYVGYRSQRAVSITNVAVKGTYFVKPENVIRQVHLHKGINPDSLDFIKIIKSVEKLPYVKQAFVRVAPPHELVVRVTERQPAAMLVDGENKIYVDMDGVKLPIIEGKSRDVPLVYGFSATGAGDTLKSNAFQTLSAFMKACDNHPLTKSTISEIACTPDEGIVALSQQNGVKLIFGKEDFDRKFNYWEAFYRQVVPGRGMNHLRSVDLRFRGQIVTRETGT